MKYTETIGIVGGMGSYATLDFFRRILDAFPAEKEWDRPRIVIDNRCTMPSRVRAILYQEEKETIVKEMEDAVRGLLSCGADHLVLDAIQAMCSFQTCSAVFRRRDQKQFTLLRHWPVVSKSAALHPHTCWLQRERSNPGFIKRLFPGLGSRWTHLHWRTAVQFVNTLKS